MFLLSIIIFVIGYYFIYVNTKNTLSYISIFALFVLPVIIGAVEEISFLLAISIFGVGVGGLIFNTFKGKRFSYKLKNFKNDQISYGYYSSASFDYALLLLFLVCSIGSIYYFYVVGISLFADEVGLQRLTARHSVSGSYLFQRLFRVILPIICIILYIRYDQGLMNTRISKYLTITAFLITSSFLVFTGLRGNLITFIFTPILILIGIFGDKFSLKRILFFFTIAFAGGLLITSLMYNSLDVIFLFSLIIERLTSGASDGITYVYFDVLDSGNYYFGVTWWNDILSLFSKIFSQNDDVLNFSAYIAKQMLGENYNGEQAAVYIFGEFYANFGMVGVLLGSLLVGCFMQFIYIFTFYIKKTLINVAFMIYFQAILIMILGGPSISMFIDYAVTLASAFILFNFVYIFVKFLLLANCRNITSA